MPELPEVETVRRGLAPVLEGARLTHVLARRPDLRFPLPDDFKGRLRELIDDQKAALTRAERHLLDAMVTSAEQRIIDDRKTDVIKRRAMIDAFTEILAMVIKLADTPERREMLNWFADEQQWDRS